MGRFAAQAWFIASTDTRFLLRQGETRLWTFVMPAVFFYFIGTVTGGGGIAPARGSDPLALVAPPNAGFLADALESRLAAQGFAVERMATPGGDAAPRRRLTIPDVPEGFSAAVAEGRRVELTLEGTGGGFESDYDRVRVNRAVWGLVGDLMVLDGEGTPADAAAVDAAAARPRRVALEVRPAGQRRHVPTGYEQAIPGTLVMFTMMVLLTGGATMLVLERRDGRLRRLASTPIPRGAVVAGKWGARMALGLVQVFFGAAVGTVLFDMRWGDSLVAVAAILFCWAAFCATVALLAGTVACTMGQIIGIGVLVTMVLAALGGCWWPIEVTPEWMQSLALFLPTGWTMDALHRLVSFGQPGTNVLPHAAGLLASSLVCAALAVRWFRYD